MTAGQSFTQSAEAYAAALTQPTTLGTFSERCNIRYNYACVCIHAGGIQQAANIIKGLLTIGGTTVQDLLSDTDFDNVRHQEWFQGLLP